MIQLATSRPVCDGIISQQSSKKLWQLRKREQWSNGGVGKHVVYLRAVGVWRWQQHRNGGKCPQKDFIPVVSRQGYSG